MKFILASTSPRRKSLLHQLQFPFEIIYPDIDETLIPFDGNPEIYCTAIAKLKANDISHHYPNELVIGADTIVLLGDKILGKPNDMIDAKKMLKELSGKTHKVFTGVYLQCTEKNIQHRFVGITKVTFWDIDEKDISHYVKRFYPYDKAGSYGIQDWSAVFIKKIAGCYDNVVGFPISQFYQELKILDINLLDTISESS